MTCARGWGGSELEKRQPNGGRYRAAERANKATNVAPSKADDIVEPVPDGVKRESTAELVDEGVGQGGDGQADGACVLALCEEGEQQEEAVEGAELEPRSERGRVLCWRKGKRKRPGVRHPARDWNGRGKVKTTSGPELDP